MEVLDTALEHVVNVPSTPGLKGGITQYREAFSRKRIRIVPDTDVMH